MWLINATWLNFRPTHTHTENFDTRKKLKRLHEIVLVSMKISHFPRMYALTDSDRLSATFPSYYRVKMGSPTVEGVIHTHGHVDKHSHSHTALTLFLSLVTCVYLSGLACRCCVSVHTRWQCWLCQRRGNVAHLREMAWPPSASRWEKQRCVTARPFDLLTPLISLDQLGNKQQQQTTQDITQRVHQRVTLRMIFSSSFTHQCCATNHQIAFFQ